MIVTAEKILNDCFKSYHKAEFIDPDPLVFPRRYNNPDDIEAAAFIAASFALGRVGCIMSFLENVFSVLGSPADGLKNRSEKDIERDFKDFKYRFYSGEDIVHFLKGLRLIYQNYGNVYNCFNVGYHKCGTTGYSNIPVVAGLTTIADTVNREGSFRNIVADPRGGSACKRLFLFLRWVVRKDEVDPGGWSLPTSELIIPLDTHIAKVGKYLALTERKSADLKTAIEITENLKKFDSEDPVKYDFSMSRIGIHPDLSYEELENRINEGL
ncbi:MAG: TIGR02757 family protein [Spirochaetales bacterium]|nr:TIGR02757 family protein [Spirochaetales bacterium]